MQVRRIDTRSRHDVRRFIHFPFGLYEGSPYWVPPLVSGIRTALDREKHPFYRHSTADFFLAEEEAGEVLGRIAVLNNRHYNDFHKTRVAFFYYFDAVNDLDVARGLFDTAAGWAREQGLDTLMGSKGLLRSDGMGILIEGFEHRAAPGVPYNYPYYRDFMKALGFEKEIDYDSAYVPGDYDLPERFYEIAEQVKQRRGFEVLSFKSKRELRKWIPRIQRVNNEAFTQVWGYYPLDAAEAQMIGRELLTIADPELMKLVIKDDELAGFSFVFPDVAGALQKTNGRLWPCGWIHLLWAFKHTRRLVGNGLGLLPKYQGLGANALMYTELFKTIRSRGQIELCDIVQVAETNAKSLGEMTAAGVHWYKKHRVYRRAL
ncbi:MAG: hypothetical protein ACLFU8_01025 [Anaerolineales bacterium]